MDRPNLFDEYVPPKKLELRDYQLEALEKIKWGMTLPGNDLLQLPTGAGKSIVIAELANYLDQDILILQPTKEILEQNKNKLSLYVNESDIGIYSASLNEKIIRKYTFATIGSVFKLAEYFAHFGTILLDEAHLLNPKKDQSMFGQFIGEINLIRKSKGLAPVKVIGFTATPYRLFPTYFTETGDWQYGAGLYQSNSIKVLTRVTPFFWQRIIYSVNPSDLMDKGYLCPLQYVDKSTIQQEMVPLNKGRTDFDLEAYDELVQKKDQEIVHMIQQASEHHNSILVFCNSVAQAERLTGYFPQGRSVSAKTKENVRNEVIEGFKNGMIPIVFNVGVLTTGFDMPSLDAIVLLRPTRSVALYYQMLGRGVRTFPGKTCCVVYDWSDTVKKIGTLESIKLAKVDGKWNVITDTTPEGWHGKELYRFKIK